MIDIYDAAFSQSHETVCAEQRLSIRSCPLLNSGRTTPMLRNHFGV